VLHGIPSVLLGQVITHHLPLSEAARGYKIFDNKYEEDGKTMVCKVRWGTARFSSCGRMRHTADAVTLPRAAGDPPDACCQGPGGALIVISLKQHLLLCNT